MRTAQNNPWPISGLHPEPATGTSVIFAAAPATPGPLWRDNRSLCMPTDNQGLSSKCVAYAWAGYAEVSRLVHHGIAEQIDPEPIYARAKELDGDDKDGTSLTQGFKACMDLGLFPSGSVCEYIYTANALRSAMFRAPYPGVVVSGFRITEGWIDTDPATGWIGSSSKPAGMHALLSCQFDGAGVGNQNSWDTTHGVHGFNRVSWPAFNKQFYRGAVVRRP